MKVDSIGSQAHSASGGGSSGFLFKPVSDSNGKLVVLAPSELTGNVESIVLKDSTGSVLDEGVFSGVGNGEREHFRFSKAGGDYPDNLVVEIRLKDGSVKTFDIADPSQRVE